MIRTKSILEITLSFIALGCFFLFTGAIADPQDGDFIPFVKPKPNLQYYYFLQTGNLLSDTGDMTKDKIQAAKRYHDLFREVESNGKGSIIATALIQLSLTLFFCGYLGLRKKTDTSVLNMSFHFSLNFLPSLLALIYVTFCEGNKVFLFSASSVVLLLNYWVLRLLNFLENKSLQQV